MDKTGNQINVLYPYRTDFGWAFDDAEVGLHREPFVAGIPEIIDSIVGGADQFIALISSEPIPNVTGVLSQVKTPRKIDPTEIFEDGSVADLEILKRGWYKLEGTEQVGWLCPATLKYFKEYPEKIYFTIQPPKTAIEAFSEAYAEKENIK